MRTNDANRPRSTAVAKPPIKRAVAGCMPNSTVAAKTVILLVPVVLFSHQESSRF